MPRLLSSRIRAFALAAVASLGFAGAAFGAATASDTTIDVSPRVQVAAPDASPADFPGITKVHEGEPLPRLWVVVSRDVRIKRGGEPAFAALKMTCPRGKTWRSGAASGDISAAVLDRNAAPASAWCSSWRRSRRARSARDRPPRARSTRSAGSAGLARRRAVIGGWDSPRGSEIQAKLGSDFARCAARRCASASISIASGCDRSEPWAGCACAARSSRVGRWAARARRRSPSRSGSCAGADAVQRQRDGRRAFGGRQNTRRAGGRAFLIVARDSFPMRSGAVMRTSTTVLGASRRRRNSGVSLTVPLR